MMTRTVLQSLLLMLVILASVEGTIDRASAGHPHSGDATHELAAFDLHDHTGAKIDDRETTESHCEHCCHGHSAGIIASAPEKSLDVPPSCAEAGHDERIAALALAPPTPRPTS